MRALEGKKQESDESQDEKRHREELQQHCGKKRQHVWSKRKRMMHDGVDKCSTQFWRSLFFFYQIRWAEKRLRVCSLIQTVHLIVTYSHHFCNNCNSFVKGCNPASRDYLPQPVESLGAQENVWKCPVTCEYESFLWIHTLSYFCITLACVYVHLDK